MTLHPNGFAIMEVEGEPSVSDAPSEADAAKPSLADKSPAL